MTTCLVIDDSPVIRKVATRILARAGVAVEEAATGAEGIAKLAATVPAVVLVAGTLSDMTGEDLVRRVRAMPNGAGVTILGMLVEANLGQMTRLKRAGCSGFVYKPFDRASLTACLAPHLPAVAEKAA
ncbi:response regulator [Aureimonas leprariae]|uniref:response regulator n=1 Tax=Plantimonas leprariae TaxID=2615207 RepID=UPI00138727B0|nr:response regulator [Aureimonas leprariae]